MLIKNTLIVIILGFLLNSPSQVMAKQPRLLGILGGTQNKNLHAADPVLSSFLRDPVTLYHKPNNDPEAPQEPVKTVPGSELYAEHYLPNRKGPIVYDHVPYGWYMVGYEGRAWWIEVLPNIHFYSYPQLVKQADAYISHWDWQLYREPGGELIDIDKKQIMSHHHEKPPIEVADSEEVGDQLWIRVKLMDSACYERDRPAQVVATGWLPAYTPDGATSLWYRVRRCSR